MKGTIKEREGMALEETLCQFSNSLITLQNDSARYRSRLSGANEIFRQTNHAFTDYLEKYEASINSPSSGAKSPSSSASSSPSSSDTKIPPFQPDDHLMNIITVGSRAKKSRRNSESESDESDSSDSDSDTPAASRKIKEMRSLYHDKAIVTIERSTFQEVPSDDEKEIEIDLPEWYKEYRARDITTESDNENTHALRSALDYMNATKDCLTYIPNEYVAWSYFHSQTNASLNELEKAARGEKTSTFLDDNGGNRRIRSVLRKMKQKLTGNSRLQSDFTETHSMDVSLSESDEMSQSDTDDEYLDASKPPQEHPMLSEDVRVLEKLTQRYGDALKNFAPIMKKFYPDLCNIAPMEYIPPKEANLSENVRNWDYSKYMREKSSEFDASVEFEDPPELVEEYNLYEAHAKETQAKLQRNFEEKQKRQELARQKQRAASELLHKQQVAEIEEYKAAQAKRRKEAEEKAVLERQAKEAKKTAMSEYKRKQKEIIAKEKDRRRGLEQARTKNAADLRREWDLEQRRVVERGDQPDRYYVIPPKYTQAFSSLPRDVPGNSVPPMLVNNHLIINGNVSSRFSDEEAKKKLAEAMKVYEEERVSTSADPWPVLEGRMDVEDALLLFHYLFC